MPERGNSWAGVAGELAPGPAAKWYPLRVVSGEEMAGLDRAALSELGLTEELLMENAGREASRLCLRLWPEADTFLVLCGPGRNGGDGYVLARTLSARGRRALAFQVGPPAAAGPTAAHARAAVAGGVPVTLLGSPSELELHRRPGAVIVDALWGTGLRRPLEGLGGQVVAWVLNSELPVLSIDLPSGVCAGTGQVLGCAVRATATVTMGPPKIGLLLEPGASLAGQRFVAEIGLRAADLRDSNRSGEWLEGQAVRGWIPERAATAHKGSCGTAWVVAGSEAYPGAAALTGEAALRVGAGLVAVATPREVAQRLSALWRELLFRPLEGSSGELEPGALERLGFGELRPRAVCVGPGLGTSDRTREAVRSWLSTLELPAVVDASALRALAHDPPTGRGWVWTPHPGEASALMGVSVQEIEADRVGWARRCAEKLEAVVVLKGAPTVIAEAGGGRYWINSTGGPVLAQGGTGDVLAGAITGLLAQGLEGLQAALCGVFLHGLAGDLKARAVGRRGILAGELCQALPAAIESALVGVEPRSSLREVS